MLEKFETILGNLFKKVLIFNGQLIRRTSKFFQYVFSPERNKVYKYLKKSLRNESEPDCEIIKYLNHRKLRHKLALTVVS